MKYLLPLIALEAIILISSSTFAEPGPRLRITSGASQFEGAAGGGLVPWAVISGYGQKGDWNANVFASRVEVDEFSTDGLGFSVAYGNRIELSFIRQQLDGSEIENLLPFPDESDPDLDVYSAKIRLYGDLIYSTLPQISLGFQYKSVSQIDNSELFGAKDDTGTDIYLAASKLFLNGIAGYPLLVNATLRSSDANQLGFLGFGGDDEENGLLLEATLGLQVTRTIVVGYEYREKPENLSIFREDDWQDFFIAWFPTKNFSVTAAYLDLGEVVLQEDQKGFYLSLQGTF